MPMKPLNFAYVTHSLVSCWNHGNAHFLRGVLRALQAQGHVVKAWEPDNNWSRANLIQDHGESAETFFRDAYPDLTVERFNPSDELDQIVSNADVVVVHEWTEANVVERLGRLRAAGKFILLFHDTHHRAVSDADAMQRYDLSRYDGVLAFGHTLAEIYRGWGWGSRAFVWHEAADVTLFKPPAQPVPRSGAVWIGNWGDGEREKELEEFLLEPARAVGLPLDIYGVRYPAHARTLLARYGVEYNGWLANTKAPSVFARHAMTVHVPRRFYAQALPGIPTIRVFEALACGIPLISAPWSDSEALFSPGEDFLVARNGSEMRNHMLDLTNDPEMAARLAAQGLSTIMARHTCDARASELLHIIHQIDGSRQEAA